MFRKGGPTNNMNGIMSGIVDRENHAVSDEMGVGGPTAKERLLALYDEYPDKSIDPLSQFLIQGGLNLMSQRPTGGVLATAAEAFKQPKPIPINPAKIAKGAIICSCRIAISLMVVSNPGANKSINLGA